MKATFTGELIALPRHTQLTHEIIKEGTPDYEYQPIGRYSDGTEFTILRLREGDRWLEVSVTGKLAHKAVNEMEVGQTYRVRVEVLGSHPHYRFRALGWRVS